MMMKLLLSAAVSSVFLVGCATSNSTDELEDTVYIGFTSAGEGAVAQKSRGFICPEELNGLTRTRAELIGDDGNDAFCNYVDSEDRIYTVYLSEFPQFSFEQYFAASMRDTGSAMQSAGLDIDENLSEACERSSLDAAALLIGLANMSDNNVIVSNDPAVVFKGEGKLSILTLNEVQPGQYLKFRYSLPGSSEEDTENACDFLRERSLAHEKEIKLATGYERTDEEKMWGFLEELDGNETAE
jgi:hypothetical protein